jgi:hypothetical protein
MPNKTALWISKRMASAWPFIIILLWHLPYFTAGEEASILIHDNLDSVIAWYKILLDKDLVFADPATEIPGIMHGLLRSSLPGYDVAGLLFNSFGMYYGYAVNKLLMSLIAYCGMLMLLKKFISEQTSHSHVIRATSLLYALLPFWSVTLSVAGLPLVFAAFIQLYRSEKIVKSWFWILIYGLGSSLVLTGIFIFFLGGIFWLSDAIKKKRIHYTFTSGFMLLAMTFVLSHYPVISSTMHHSGYISHRTEMHAAGSTLAQSIKETFQIGLFGQLHAQSLHTLLVVPLLMVLVIMWRKKSIPTQVYWMLAFIIATSVVYGLLTWEGLASLKQKQMSVFPVQLQRFHFFHPMLWYALFAIASVFLIKQFRLGKKILLGIFVIQFLYITSNHELVVNMRHPSFKDFFAASTFASIKADHPKLLTDQCVSIGIHPSVAQWNGLNTIDGYFADYPLVYKHAFRQVIAPALEQDDQIREYFDHWGSRCYAFSSEVGTQIPMRRNSSIIISKPFINYEVALNLGCRYILSGFPIEGNATQLTLKGSYNSTTDLPIYLYQIN